ncbi:MAG: hypothetical protein ACP5EN_09125 [Rhodovulum sp.]
MKELDIEIHRNRRTPDTRAHDLSLVQLELQARHPDYQLDLCAQGHCGVSGFACIIIYGVDDDTLKRREIRSEAELLLKQLGHDVELSPGRDVYMIEPRRPASAHEKVMMLKEFRERLAEISNDRPPDP